MKLFGYGMLIISVQLLVSKRKRLVLWNICLISSTFRQRKSLTLFSPSPFFAPAAREHIVPPFENHVPLVLTA